MSGFKKNMEKFKENSSCCRCQKKVTSLPKKKVATSENFTTSEEVDKGTKKFDDMKEAVITILRKDLDHFEG